MSFLLFSCVHFILRESRLTDRYFKNYHIKRCFDKFACFRSHHAVCGRVCVHVGGCFFFTAHCIYSISVYRCVCACMCAVWLKEAKKEAAYESLTCTLLADDHTEIDWRPLRPRGATVGTAPVGLVEPDLFCHFIVGECLSDRFLDCFNPLLLLPFWLGREAVTIDFLPPTPTQASLLLI